MPVVSENEALRYSVSLVTQGNHRFYTLTMPSEVLAETCFVTTRDEDPKKGFQRVLDKKRAEEIADYIDNGFGTIPNSIVLSAQPEADLQIVGKGKTLQFKRTKRAFLVLDGQHRVYGFSLAKTSLRVPVVIFNSLSRKDESRLFIDINTKQRPVPNTLLLDIKMLADYETSEEQLLRGLFDFFNSDPFSPLLGLMSPAKKATGRISRVTFNAAFKPLLASFSGIPEDQLYPIMRAYLNAFIAGLGQIDSKDLLTNPTVFRAAVQSLIEVAQRVQDRHGKEYTEDNFNEVLEPLFGRVRRTSFRSAVSSIKTLSGVLSKQLRADFAL